MAEQPVFIDTGYLVALLNPNDALHSHAKALASVWQSSNRSVVTTDAVLLELANFFSESKLRNPCIAALRRIRGASGWSIEPLSPALIDRGETRYAAHPDKNWSLTDCLSMEVMLARGLLEAATPDHHFAQAGFRVLMKAGG